MLKLKQSLSVCDSVYGKGGQAAPLINNIGHTSLLDDNIVTYRRILGVKPPSS